MPSEDYKDLEDTDTCPEHAQAAAEAHRLIQSKNPDDIDRAFELKADISECPKCEAVLQAATKIRKRVVDVSA